jgi:Asp-tRNA(Asn)/Glu-tRNA(Gln) amidotransferase A subunit family amidase
VSDLTFLSAEALAAGYRARQFSVSEVIDAILDRIERDNPLVNAYCTLIPDRARAEAAAADRALAQAEMLGPLHGVPISIKDVIATAGVRTTRGSRVYADHVPEEDAPVVSRLKAAGAIVLGKTNTPEFGWKSPTDNLLFGPTRNPWDLNRTSAGSSGGAAAAVACGLGPIGIGSDGGGSIRQPASFCGVFGLKPSFGLVPSVPAGAANTFGSIGPLTRTVRDAALALNCIAGPDERDWFAQPRPDVDYLAACSGDIRGLRVAWSPDLGYAAVEPEVRRIADAAARTFTDLGCDVEEAAPGWREPSELFHVLFYGMFGAVVEDLLPDWRDQLDPGLVWIADLGRQYSAYDVSRAHRKRLELQDTARRFFEKYDLLLTPTMTLPPFGLGISYPREVAGVPVRGMQWTAFTFPFNLTGQPAASVPCGWTAEGLPVGLQVVGRRHDDASVLRACAAFERSAPWTDRRPVLDAAQAPPLVGATTERGPSPF